MEEMGLDETKHNVLHGTFEEALTELLDNVSDTVPAFCFIDPFGYSGLPLELICRFLKRPSTESFINFMYEPINLFLGVDHQEDQMNLLFGTDEWKYVITSNLIGLERETFLSDL